MYFILSLRWLLEHGFSLRVMSIFSLSTRYFIRFYCLWYLCWPQNGIHPLPRRAIKSNACHMRVDKFTIHLLLSFRFVRLSVSLIHFSVSVTHHIHACNFVSVGNIERITRVNQDKNVSLWAWCPCLNLNLNTHILMRQTPSPFCSRVRGPFWICIF